jgi:apolipoprotein N-acyltransferase
LIHLVLASFRTIETRRALIRSTNTGISAFVDPAGRIERRAGQWTKETLIDDVPLIDDGSTTIYMMVGDVYGYLALVLVAVGYLKSRRDRRSRPSTG